MFHVASLRSLLREYLDEETLNEVCDENVDSKIGIDRLHHQVIAANDDELYSLIMNYFEEKCSA